jgi:hypothetical protein
MTYDFGDNHFTITNKDGYYTINCMNSSTFEVFEIHFNQFDVDDFMENVYANHFSYNTKNSGGEPIKTLFRTIIQSAFENGKVFVDATSEGVLHILIKMVELNDVYRFAMKRDDWKSNDLRTTMCLKLISELREENALLRMRVEVLETDLAKVNG